MATIKERAHQYGCKAAGGWYKGGMEGAVYDTNHDAYIEIATEQQKIDIDKACEWFLSQIDYDDSGRACRVFFRDSVERFRKAMEE